MTANLSPSQNSGNSPIPAGRRNIVPNAAGSQNPLPPAPQQPAALAQQQQAAAALARQQQNAANLANRTIISIRPSSESITVTIKGVEFEVTVKDKGGRIKPIPSTGDVWSGKDGKGGLKATIEACIRTLERQDASTFSDFSKIEQISLRLAEGKVKVWNEGEDLNTAASKTIQIAKEFSAPFNALAQELVSKAVVNAFKTPSHLASLGRDGASALDLEASARDISDGEYLDGTTLVHAMNHLEFKAHEKGENVKFVHSGSNVLTETGLKKWQKDGQDIFVTDPLKNLKESGFNGRAYVPIKLEVNHYCLIVIDFENRKIYAYDPQGYRFQKEDDPLYPALQKLAKDFNSSKWRSNFTIDSYKPDPSKAHQTAISGANCGSFCLKAMEILEHPSTQDRYEELKNTSYENDPTLHKFRQDIAKNLRSFKQEVEEAQKKSYESSARNTGNDERVDIVELPKVDGDDYKDGVRNPGGYKDMDLQFSSSDPLTKAQELGAPCLVVVDAKKSNEDQTTLTKEVKLRTNIIDQPDLNIDKAFYVPNAEISRKGLSKSYVPLNAAQANINFLYTPIESSIEEEEIKKIIYTQLKKAEDAGLRHVIIGSWGRELGYDPEKIAELYFDVIKTHFNKRFESIAFAIPDNEDTEYHSKFHQKLDDINRRQQDIPISF